LPKGEALFSTDVTPEGKINAVQGLFVGYVHHKKNTYLQTDLVFHPENVGAGVFDSHGHLVGIVSFQLGDDLTFVLPMDYIFSGNTAFAEDLVGKKAENPKFLEQRNKALTQADALTPPIRFDSVLYEQNYSHTALIGTLTFLEKQDTPVHSQPIRYMLYSIDAEQKKRELANKTFAAQEIIWDHSQNQQQALNDRLTNTFGGTFVKKHFEPYVYGELHYRLPFTSFCKKIRPTEVHSLAIILADGRKSGEIGFADLINICAGVEGDEGDVLARKWGFDAEDKKERATNKNKKVKSKNKKQQVKKKQRKR